MKNKIIFELNKEYTVCGQKMIVVSHFVGNKNLDEELYRLAFDKALDEMLNKTV